MLGGDDMDVPYYIVMVEVAQSNGRLERK